MRFVCLGCLFAGWVAAIFFEFGAVYFCLASLAYIFANLGQRSQNSKSAYSVFNKDCYRIPGTLGAEQFENELRHKTNKAPNTEFRLNNEEMLEMPTRISKCANKKCLCGSGKKFKHCCSPNTGMSANQGTEDDDCF